MGSDSCGAHSSPHSAGKMMPSEADERVAYSRGDIGSGSRGRHRQKQRQTREFKQGEEADRDGDRDGDRETGRE